MRALCWHGKRDVRVDAVPDPKIQHPRDAVIQITACAICGSNLHLHGYQPTMESGDILGGAETIYFSKTDVYDELMRRTNMRGPDGCIDAVGCEASGHGAADAVLDKVKAAAFFLQRIAFTSSARQSCAVASRAQFPYPVFTLAWATQFRWVPR